MRTICCFLLSLGSAFFAFTHLSDPVDAVEQMVGTKSTDPLVAHAIAVIGALHATLAVIFLFAAGSAAKEVRAAALRAEVIFCLIASWVQITFPATGTPPGPTEMPFPVLYAFGALALIGLFAGEAEPRTLKKNN